MIVTKTQADGYFKVSEGQAQIQLIRSMAVVGIIHSNTVPDNSDEAHFTVSGSAINVSLGTKPCYLKVISGGVANIAYEDISV